MALPWQPLSNCPRDITSYKLLVGLALALCLALALANTHLPLFWLWLMPTPQTPPRAAQAIVLRIDLGVMIEYPPKGCAPICCYAIMANTTTQGCVPFGCCVMANTATQGCALIGCYVMANTATHSGTTHLKARSPFKTTVERTPSFFCLVKFNRHRSSTYI